jgi:glycerophosphoryl diester phosphodiesterase
MNNKLIIAHRGASKLAADNTLESFQKAMELGADIVEFDIRRTMDNVLVVMHDTAFKGRPVKRLPYSRILELSQGRIPTLEQVLSLLSGKMKLDMELKEEGIGKEAVELALKYFSPENFIVTSRYLNALKGLRENFHGVRLGWVVGNSLKSLVPQLGRLFFRGVPEFCDILVLNWKLFILGLGRSSGAKDLFVFTVNGKRAIERMAANGSIKGIITDRPDLALNIKDNS